MDGDGFEPSKPVATDLQSVPFDRSGTRPGDYVKLSDVLVAALLRPGELAKGLEPATC